MSAQLELCRPGDIPPSPLPYLDLAVSAGDIPPGLFDARPPEEIAAVADVLVLSAVGGLVVLCPSKILDEGSVLDLPPNDEEGIVFRMAVSTILPPPSPLPLGVPLTKEADKEVGGGSLLLECRVTDRTSLVE